MYTDIRYIIAVQSIDINARAVELWLAKAL